MVYRFSCNFYCRQNYSTKNLPIKKILFEDTEYISLQNAIYENTKSKPILYYDLKMNQIQKMNLNLAIQWTMSLILMKTILLLIKCKIWVSYIIK